MTISVVPWINQEEFDTVYNWIFADRKQHLDLIQRGLDRVQAWCNRGMAPYSVEITAILIEAILRDERFGHTMSHRELRLLYTMAIIRFVNGLVDQRQTGKYALSVLTIAKKIGLPSWFVDLRHEGTHERLPHLIVLRSAATQAVAWLHDHYWIHNLKKPEEEKKDHDIKMKLNMYKERRKAYIKGVKAGEMKLDPAIYVDCISALIEVIDEDIIREEIIPLLLGIGGLVPTAKKKRASLENMKISNDLIELWTPLLKGLDVGYPGFALDLVSSIVQKFVSSDEYVLNEQAVNPYAMFSQQQQQESEDPTKSKSYMLTLACWLKYFALEMQNPIDERTLGKLDIDDLLEGCLRNPNYYTRYVLQALCQVDPDLAETIKPFMRYMDQLLIKLTLKQKETPSLESVDDAILEQDLTTLKRQIAEIKTTQRRQRPAKRQRIESKSWKLHDRWQTCPLGMLPNGKVPCLDMREWLKK
ncbi:hypothetical protein RMCBS344292_05604 [Rhizopus microsporus]|nr:hypothetical protein RMCBS344292_05604 [Rhizopus microsporus]